MASFTNGVPEMVNAMVDALPERYPMNLVPEDMEALIWILSTTVGFVSLDDIPEDTRERAENIFSCIAETLEVEGI